MQHRYRRLKRSIRLEIAPLLDVIFILLIFFAVATSITIMTSGIKLQLPTASTVEPDNKGLSISIDSSNAIWIDDQPATLLELKTVIENKTAENPTIAILVHADQSLPYQSVITILDAIRQSNGQNIILKAEKQAD